MEIADPLVLIWPIGTIVYSGNAHEVLTRL